MDPDQTAPWEQSDQGVHLVCFYEKSSRSAREGCGGSVVECLTQNPGVVG